MGERDRPRRIGDGPGDFADPVPSGADDVDGLFFGTARGPREIHGAMRREVGIDGDLPPQRPGGWPDVSGLRGELGLD